ncbi:MAG: hypothetical protein RLZZ229_84 [Actinomycetota bacterium]|jgi:thiamine biosynthesis lipoprotein
MNKHVPKINVRVQPFEHVELCMGTAFRFAGNTPLSSTETAYLVFSACAKLHEADQLFSLYKPESQLSQLARGETNVDSSSPLVGEMWEMAMDWEKETQGWFSAFTPQRTFDPSGIVKTWAAIEAALVLMAGGITDFTVNAGGDVWLGPDLTERKSFRIGIHKPVSIAAEDAGVLTVIDLFGTKFTAMATSGSAERGGHIWNPKQPDAEPNELLQVSVVSTSLVRADVWATAAFAAGKQGIKLLEEQKDLEALFILANGELASTSGFAALLAKP